MDIDLKGKKGKHIKEFLRESDNYKTAEQIQDYLKDRYSYIPGKRKIWLFLQDVENIDIKKIDEYRDDNQRGTKKVNGYIIKNN